MTKIGKEEDSHYIEPKELTAAKKVAMVLRRPLLLSGEPGTGKTTYADHIASTEGYNIYPFKTKSISTATELFYMYDAVSHFANNKKHVLNFIHLQPLGIAIVCSLGVDNQKEKLRQRLGDDIVFAEEDDTVKNRLLDNFFKKCKPGKSLVLIDEIDKAPRDFPNDILNEIERNEFEIKELDISFPIQLQDETRDENQITETELKKEKIIEDVATETDMQEAMVKEPKPELARMFIILTSNFEKNLPDAFLRRCIYYHIPFPKPEKLKEIVIAHLGEVYRDDKRIDARIKEFDDIRNRESIQKKPATSELIDCMTYLAKENQLDIPLTENPAALSAILKKLGDVDLILQTPQAAY